MERKELEVYSEASNQAVVRPPGRQFPGSVIQGDSLAHLLSLARASHQRACQLNDPELMESTEELLNLLDQRLAHYEQALACHHMDLPYPNSQRSSVRVLFQEYCTQLRLEGTDRLVLGVLCGGVGQYGVEVTLNEEERAAYKAQGDAFIRELADYVRHDPQTYSQRRS